MPILALDTSTSHLSVALDPGGGGRAIAVHREVGQAHAEEALPVIRRLLDAADVAMADLDAIAFGTGPGSFTGVRIACGIAQGLALAVGCPLVAVGSFEAMAETLALRSPRVPGRHRVIAAIDARMHELYWCALERTDDRTPGVWREVVPACVAPAAGVALPPAGQWIGCGSGFAIAGPALAARLGDRLGAVFADIQPQADAMLVIASRRLARGEVLDPAQAAPRYVRDQVARTRSERAQASRPPGASTR